MSLTNKLVCLSWTGESFLWVYPTPVEACRTELHALCKCLCVPENIVDCTLNYFFLTNNWSGTSELGGVNELVMKLLMP